MFESEGVRRAWKEREASARAEQIRVELVAQLRRDGPRTAIDLLARVETEGVSLSEVVFQLGRLAEEGKAAGDADDGYRAI